jgi:hypothetical protein
MGWVELASREISFDHHVWLSRQDTMHRLADVNERDEALFA